MKSWNISYGMLIFVDAAPQCLLQCQSRRLYKVLSKGMLPSVALCSSAELARSTMAPSGKTLDDCVQQGDHLIECVRVEQSAQNF
mmetsp:Transcript_20313/g.48798  ORF Transcript_20313/g.48798 Transcript_20313/m.48798 type:complete len:85 (+) Transcript_20313:2053-2307(+)